MEPRILVVRLGAVGDVIRALPLLHALRRAAPRAHLGWLVEEPAAALLRELPALDVVHVLPRRTLARQLARPWDWPAAWKRLGQLRRELGGQLYDVVLDVHGTLKAALASRSAGGRRVGFARGGSRELAWLSYDVAHPFPAAPMSRVRRALLLAHAEGILGPTDATGEPGDGRVDFGLRFAPERVRAIAGFAESADRRLVVLFPFASATGQAKRWPLRSFLDLAARLGDDGERVVVAWGSARERLEIERASASGVELAPPTDLVELCELLRAADLLVTGDTGPMHLAAAVGTRVLALFGPSDPVVNRPWGEGHRVLVRQPLASLGVEDVLQPSRELLSESSRSPAQQRA